VTTRAWKVYLSHQPFWQEKNNSLLLNQRFRIFACYSVMYSRLFRRARRVWYRD